MRCLKGLEGERGRERVTVRGALGEEGSVGTAVGGLIEGG